jgi:hypothetical protein
MTLQKRTAVDLIQVDEKGVVYIREKTDIYDDDEPSVIISSNCHRESLIPGQDYSQRDARVKAVCAAVQTSEVINAYKAAIAAQGV